MAKIKYIGNHPKISMIKGMSCKRGETIDIHPIHALTYMGASDWEIQLDAEDKEILSKVNRKFHIRQLNREFGGQGLDEALEKAFPKAASRFGRKTTPKKAPAKKTPAKKPAAKKEPKKEELKPPIEEKKEPKKEAPKAKKPTKDSEV